MLAGVTAASAHVGVTPDKTDANSYALLTFGIPHGCDDSGTTKAAPYVAGDPALVMAKYDKTNAIRTADFDDKVRARMIAACDRSMPLGSTCPAVVHPILPHC